MKFRAPRSPSEVSGPVVVKVCLIVLGVMGIVVVLDDSIQDHGQLSLKLEHLASNFATTQSLGLELGQVP